MQVNKRSHSEVRRSLASLPTVPLGGTVTVSSKLLSSNGMTNPSGAGPELVSTRISSCRASAGNSVAGIVKE